MAKNGVKIAEKVILEELKGEVNDEINLWLIPKKVK
jgi:hypothetical protein